MKWRKVLVVLLLGVFLYSSYQIFSYLYVSHKEKSTYDQIRELYAEELKYENQFKEEGNTAPSANLPEKTNISGKGSIMERYAPLLEINSDLVGWVSVPDTVIDYPVVQAKDNNYYLRRDIHGNSARAGTIFMDYRSDARARGRHTILYGHHMRNGSMFKDLEKYKNEGFFQENGYIRFDTLFAEIEWEVFAVYITDTNFPYTQVTFASDEDYMDFLKRIKNKSMYQKDIELTEEDQILTLSTCTYEYDDARFVVHARRVRK